MSYLRRLKLKWSDLTTIKKQAGLSDGRDCDAKQRQLSAIIILSGVNCLFLGDLFRLPFADIRKRQAAFFLNIFAWVFTTVIVIVGAWPVFWVREQRGLGLQQRRRENGGPVASRLTGRLIPAPFQPTASRGNVDENVNILAKDAIG